MNFLKAILAVSVAVFAFTFGRDFAHKTMGATASTTPATGS